MPCWQKSEWYAASLKAADNDPPDPRLILGHFWFCTHGAAGIDSITECLISDLLAQGATVGELRSIADALGWASRQLSASHARMWEMMRAETYVSLRDVVAAGEEFGAILTLLEQTIARAGSKQHEWPPSSGPWLGLLQEWVVHLRRLQTDFRATCPQE